MKSLIKYILLIAFLLAVLIGLFFASPWIADNCFRYNIVKNNLGDVFTMTSALFTGLAFFGVIITLFFQMQAFKEQQKEIKNQKQLLDEQLKTAKITAQLNLLPSLIDNSINILSNKLSPREIRIDLSVWQAEKSRKISVIYENWPTEIGLKSRNVNKYDLFLTDLEKFRFDNKSIAHNDIKKAELLRAFDEAINEYKNYKEYCLSLDSLLKEIALDRKKE